MRGANGIFVSSHGEKKSIDIINKLYTMYEGGKCYGRKQSRVRRTDNVVSVGREGSIFKQGS